MRIAFVTQWFPPEPGTFVAAAIADGLAERGHHVDVLTGFPNYPTGEFHPDYPVQSYRRDHRSERVTVHRAPVYPSHDKNPGKRIANYLSFGFSAAWIARTRLSRPDVWLTYSSPATAALPALTVPHRLRAPSFLLIQDLWPDSVSGSGFLPGRSLSAIESALHLYCNWSYRNAAGIGVISPSMNSILLERGVPQERIHYTPNWIDERHLLPDVPPSDQLRRQLGLPTGKLFMHAGNVGEFQGLRPLIEAFARCPDVNLALVGDGVARSDLQAFVAGRRFGNVYFVDAQPASRIGSFIAASDVQVVSLQDTALLRATMPSKVQASMAAARPILAHASGDVADIVRSASAGMWATPGDLAGTASTIHELAALSDDTRLNLGRSAQTHYREHFSLPVGLTRMERMLTLGKSRSRERSHQA